MTPSLSSTVLSTIPSTMKAAVLWDLHQPLRILELPIQHPGPGQILVKVAATGLCRAQLLEIRGENTIGPMNPNMLGHEGSGIVVEVGPGITKVQPGDHVILSWIKGSGANVLPQKYEYNGQKINCGFVTTFNEYTLAAENRVTKIPQEMPFLEASIIGCAVATGAGAVFHNAKVQPGKSVAVVGVGGIGINMLHAAAVVKAHPLIAVDVNDDKLDFARKFGASHTINSQTINSQTINAQTQNVEKIEEELKKIAGTDGLDYAFDTTGRKEMMELVYRSVKKATGRAVFCGVPNPPGTKIEIDPFPLYFGRQAVGTGGGECQPDQDFEKFCRMALHSHLNIREMITHVLPLERINEGFELMKESKCCRVVVDFGLS